MYISADGGRSPSYTKSAFMTSACVIPLEAGEYELSFDWLAGSAAGKDYLFVGWMPDSVKTNSSPSGGSRPKDDIGQYLLVADSVTPPVTDTLRSAWWTTSMFRFEVKDATIPYKLVFFWSNTENASATKGACIDNIQIMPKGACPEPSDLRVETKDGGVTLHWTGVADRYDVKCYSQESGKWYFENGIVTDSVDLKELTEGMCDFYVRAVCEEGYSRWVSISKLVYLPEVLCIDYLNLTDNNCWHSSESTGFTLVKGKIDNGYGMMSSRHTIHMVRDEYDANTGNKLKTIPDGELASVRLGNWDVNGESERIEYTYTVDAEHAAVLMLKYAAVLQEPEDHGEDQQPRFELKVLKANGNSLGDDKCGEAVFRAGFDTRNDTTWHEIPGEDGTSVWWKEWTTIGINLQEYDGQRLKVLVTTYDCSLGGHYGYAYFTLGCSNGQMEGVACGDIPTTEFIAPEGFNYHWYSLNPAKEYDVTGNVFPVDPTDTVTYYCDLIFPTNDKCYFTLSASAKPRYPVADGSWSLSAEQCMNEVSFINTSRILLVNQVEKDTIVESQRCEQVFWDFGDGSTSTEYEPKHVFPVEGGTYYVNLEVSIGDGRCPDDTTFVLKLPDLRTTRDTISDYACQGTSVYLPGQGRDVWTDGLYPDTLKSVIYPCRDSIVVHDVKFGYPSDVVIYDTICSGTHYLFDGQMFTETTIYETPVKTNIYGCDSVATLYLTAFETLEVEMSSPIVCADEQAVDVPYEILSGLVDSYSLQFGVAGKAAGFEDVTGDLYASPLTFPLPDKVRPGHYEADMVFMDEACGNDTIPLNISIFYPSSILSQRWDDVLFVQNADYNGGYEFSTYQWYKNDEPIDGETASYLYASDGLDQAAEYRVELTRSDDGMTVSTCPVGGEVQVLSAHGGMASLYSLSGVLLSRQPLAEGTTSLTAPTQAGYYLFRVELDNGQVKTYHLQIVK